MFTIINEDLYSFNCVKGIDPRTKLDSYKITVATSNKLLHYKNTQDQPKKRFQNGVENHNPPPESVPREILTIQTPSDDLDAYTKLPISLRVGENQRGNPTVAIRCLGENDTNNANVYLLAIPFNGMINPIPEDPKYHIYKGMIGSSVRPFFFNGRRYKKILYLVVEPHMKLFAPDHKYHTDCIDIRVDTYAIITDKDTNKEKTNHETYTFSVVSADGMYRENWNYETLDESVYVSNGDGQPVWHTFKFIQKDREAKPYQLKKKQNNGRREGYVSGNTYVTTNKHGIRKEVPLRNKDGNEGRSYNNGRNEKFNRKNGTDNEFERMLQESGMYDDDRNDRRNNFNRKKGGKKGNRNNRSQYDY